MNYIYFGNINNNVLNLLYINYILSITRRKMLECISVNHNLIKFDIQMVVNSNISKKN